MPFGSPDHCQSAHKITLIFGQAVQSKLRELANISDASSTEKPAVNY